VVGLAADPAIMEKSGRLHLAVADLVLTPASASSPASIRPVGPRQRSRLHVLSSVNPSHLLTSEWEVNGNGCPDMREGS